MRHLTNTYIDADERVRVTGRPDLGVTILRIGRPLFEDSPHLGGETIHLGGTPADRAAFLRHMAEQLTAAADALDAVEVAS